MSKHELHEGLVKGKEPYVIQREKESFIYLVDSGLLFLPEIETGKSGVITRKAISIKKA